MSTMTPMHVQMSTAFIGEPFSQLPITLKITLKLGRLSIIILTLYWRRQLQTGKLTHLVPGLERYKAEIMSILGLFLPSPVTDTTLHHIPRHPEHLTI